MMVAADRWSCDSYAHRTWIGTHFYLGSVWRTGDSWRARIHGPANATNLGDEFPSSSTARAAVDAKFAEIRALADDRKWMGQTLDNARAVEAKADRPVRRYHFTQAMDSTTAGAMATSVTVAKLGGVRHIVDPDSMETGQA